MPEDKTKKLKDTTIAIFLVFVMVGIIYSAFWGPVRQYIDAYSSSLYPTKTFSVSAEGKVMVSPDTAEFTFSVVSEGKDSKTLDEENNNSMNAAIAFVKSSGVDEKDVKTIQYDLSPKYEYDEKTKKTSISGYSLVQTVLVKVRDLTRVAEIVGGLPALGINQIGSISFKVDDPEKFLAEARKQAFEKARAKALEVASQNGVSVGDIVGFWESGVQPYYGYDSFGIGGKGGEGVTSITPQIQTGTQEIIVQASISYEIR